VPSCRGRAGKVQQRAKPEAHFATSSTPPGDRGLRDIIVKLSKDYLKSLLACLEFESIMEEYGDFRRDLVKVIAYRPEPEPNAAIYMCGGCRKLMTV